MFHPSPRERRRQRLTYCGTRLLAAAVPERSRQSRTALCNARSGKHDDLVLALAIAVWRAHGGGMASYGLFEVMRQQALGLAASEPRYYVGVDLGQSRDPTAIAVVRRVHPPEAGPGG